MNIFFKILSIILTILLMLVATFYFNNNIITWLYEPTNNLSVIGIVTIIVATGVIILINKLNTIYELIIYINFSEEEVEEEETEY